MLNPEQPLIATSSAVARIPGLATLLGCPVILSRHCQQPAQTNGVIAWGLKPSALKAALYARRHQLPLLRLEDGFLRSVEAGHQAPPLSLVLDDIGIYYDAANPSRLEQLIQQPLTEQQQQRSLLLQQQWQQARVSKYNHAREYAGELPNAYVLVIDQVAGDASIAHGLASAESFQSMLNAALADYPDCTIILKVHPDVLLKRKRGHFDLAYLSTQPRIRILADASHPVRLIAQAKAVYCVTSQIGFEALLWQKPVRVFGMPFYAGWGLTDDDIDIPESSRHPITLAQLIHASLIAYSRYLDPETHQRCEPERLIAWMGLQRQMRERFPVQLQGLGFSWYKKPIVRRFLQGSVVSFDKPAHHWPAATALVVWHNRAKSMAERYPGQPMIHIEDGFIRSVGLGADLIQPLSWAIDCQGIYYDATQPSDLEQLLLTTDFDDTLLARADELIQRLVAHDVTKYNMAGEDWLRPKHNVQRVILVPGQVETDASLAYGAPGLRSNMALLTAVREANPKAYIVYKPHPDVVVGLRAKGQQEDLANRYCDELIITTPMGKLLNQVDEVHTLTSLTGFEALLRGKTVVCYGQPFYAGWGLTRDNIPIARRQRLLTLQQLVAGALILYPTYVSRTTGYYTTPERALDELIAWLQQAPKTLPWWRVLLREILKLENRLKGR